MKNQIINDLQIFDIYFMQVYDIGSNYGSEKIST